MDKISATKKYRSCIFGRKKGKNTRLIKKIISKDRLSKRTFSLNKVNINRKVDTHIPKIPNGANTEKLLLGMN